MKCQYCGRDNPDGETFCECGRPLRLGGTSSAPASTGGYTPSSDSPFASQTLDSVKRTRSIPWAPIIVVICALIGVGVFFGLRWLQGKHVTDESSWKTIDEPLFSITASPDLDKGEMLTVQGGAEDLIGFYTSRLAGFDVRIRKYTDPEKEVYGKLSAADFAKAQKIRTVKINGQEVKYETRAGKNYIYAEYNRHCINHIKKTDEVWYIEAMFPTANCYYIVDAYCAQEDKDAYRESLFKWLDSFTPKY